MKSLGIELHECSFTFRQDNTTVGEFIEFAIDDEGAGPFFVIKTERWSVDDLKDLAALFEHVAKTCQKLLK